MDYVPHPFPAGPRVHVFVPVEPERLAPPIVLAVVREEPLACNELGPAVAREVRKRRSMRLGPSIIDRVPLPCARAVGTSHLLEPEDAIAVGVRRHDVVQSVPVNIQDMQKTDVLVEVELRVHLPGSLARIGRSLEPSLRRQHVDATVCVDIPCPDPVAVGRCLNDVPSPGRPVSDRLEPSCR